jgi:alanyl-tRNA synthetase
MVHSYLFNYLGKEQFDYENPIKEVVKFYEKIYKNLNQKEIIDVIRDEYIKFSQTLDIGLKEMNKTENIDAMTAFKFYGSYGIPFEVIKDLAEEKTKELTREAFDAEFAKHQEISRAGAEKKFGGHGLVLDTGELKAGNEEELKKVTRLHTATHLINQALRETLGNEVEQRGSDINPERARFDFTFGRKMTPEELKTVEKKVNAKIKEDLKVVMQEMPKSEAEKTGALHFFKGKYPDTVSVYFISPDGTLPNAWSKEFCGGPHVTHTSEIGGIKILKEEASSAGVRRIRFALAG